MKQKAVIIWSVAREVGACDVSFYNIGSGGAIS